MKVVPKNLSSKREKGWRCEAFEYLLFTCQRTRGEFGSGIQEPPMSRDLSSGDRKLLVLAFTLFAPGSRKNHPSDDSRGRISGLGCV